MKVAVPVVRVVQMAVHEVVHVVAVRYGRVPAPFSVNVRGVVATTAVRGGTAGRILVTHVDLMLFDTGATLVVQMAVVEIVDMAVVEYGCVSAAGAVRVGMIVMH